MELQWLGHDSCLIKSGTVKIAINPRKELAKPNCDLVVTTIDEPTFFHNLKEENNTFTCDWPGEYELKDVLVSGIEAEDTDLLGVHTLFNVHLPEDIAVGVITGLKNKVSPQLVEKLGNIDVLLLDISAETFSPKVAFEMVELIEPKAVVPLCSDDALREEFIKTLGLPATETEGTLKIISSALPAEGTILFVPVSNA